MLIRTIRPLFNQVMVKTCMLDERIIPATFVKESLFIDHLYLIFIVFFLLDSLDDLPLRVTDFAIILRNLFGCL